MGYAYMDDSVLHIYEVLPWTLVLGRYNLLNEPLKIVD